MTAIQRNSAVVFAGLAFGHADRDLMRVPEPRVGSSICYAWNDVLRSPEGEGGGGGGDPPKTFTQDDVNRIVQERVGKTKSEMDAMKAQLAELETIKAKLAEADTERAAALEAKELEGKSELEKLKIQLGKSADILKTKEAEWQKKHADAEALAKQHESRFVDHVKRSAISDALVASGALGSAIGDASMSFLGEAQVELDEKHGIKSIVVGGKTFEKPADAAKHFLSTKPYYASAPAGGSGGPKNAGGNPITTTDVLKSAADDDFAVGFSKPAAGN